MAFVLQKNRNEVKGIGRIFHADILCHAASCTWVYCLATKTAEKRQGCKWKGDNVAPAGADDRVP